MAIGITMYNENWDLVMRTLKGIGQGILDIYKDEVDIWRKAGIPEGEKPGWQRFRD